MPSLTFTYKGAILKLAVFARFFNDSSLVNMTNMSKLRLRETFLTLYVELLIKYTHFFVCLDKMYSPVDKRKQEWRKRYFNKNQEICRLFLEGRPSRDRTCSQTVFAKIIVSELTCRFFPAQHSRNVSLAGPCFLLLY